MASAQNADSQLELSYLIHCTVCCRGMSAGTLDEVAEIAHEHYAETHPGVSAIAEGAQYAVLANVKTCAACRALLTMEPLWLHGAKTPVQDGRPDEVWPLCGPCHDFWAGHAVQAWADRIWQARLLRFYYLKSASLEEQMEVIAEIGVRIDTFLQFLDDGEKYEAGSSRMDIQKIRASHAPPFASESRTLPAQSPASRGPATA